MIYADYNGTQPIKENVKKYLIERLAGPFANPNAIHSMGRNISEAIKKCRIVCAESLGATPEQIIFTSGSSESIAQIFHSIEKNTGKLLSSCVEHAAVRNNLKALAKNGFEYKKLQYSDEHEIIIPEVEKFDLACLMAANNESGIIFNTDEFSAWCKKSDSPFFSDTTQLIGKREFNFNESGMDYAVLSGHKLGAPTGVGILLAKNPSTLKPLILGGGQERGYRGGTQNYLGIECLALVVSELSETIQKYKKVGKLKAQFEKSLLEKIPGLVIFGEQLDRLPNTTLFAIPGIHGQAVQIELESRDIFVTTSSACSDNFPTASDNLLTIGYPEEIARGSIRISMNDDCTESDYMKLQASLIDSLQNLNRIKIN